MDCTPRGFSLAFLGPSSISILTPEELPSHRPLQGRLDTSIHPCLPLASAGVGIQPLPSAFSPVPPGFASQHPHHQAGWIVRGMICLKAKLLSVKPSVLQLGGVSPFDLRLEAPSGLISISPIPVSVGFLLTLVGPAAFIIYK